MLLELKIGIGLSMIRDLMIVLSLHMMIKRGMVDLSMIKGMMIMRSMRKYEGLIEADTMIGMTKAIHDLVQSLTFHTLKVRCILMIFLIG